MANALARLALVLALAALGLACKTVAPLPMLLAKHASTHASEGAASSTSAR